MQPTVIAIAGPNGAGKTSVAESFLRNLLGVDHYVNADTIARGLSQFEPQSVAIEAGRQNLRRLDDLAGSRSSFAFETTLAGIVYATRIKRWKADRYRFLLAFFWLRGVSIALERVAARVASGGHGIPEDVIRKRYDRGLVNFFKVYRPLADQWLMYDNSEREPRLVATGSGDGRIEIADQSTWSTISTSWR
jgi:predicted ABC-type ATPase